MNKRILSGLAALALTFSGAGTALMNATDLHFEVAASAADVAESGTCGENLTWTLDKKGTLTISGTGEMDNYTNDGSTPWSIADVKDVVIGNGVTNIGEFAFYDCTNLESVTIPDSVTSIGTGAFTHCSSLKSITIPGSVALIDYGAFANCTCLESIILHDGVMTIGRLAFYNCSNIKNINIPDSVTLIDYGAFHKCSCLESINIPDSVTGIGKAAFDSCESLTSITIPDSVASMGEGAFYGCSILTSAELGNGITSIDGYVFYGCENLTSVTIPESIASIGRYAFASCQSLTSVTIPKSVKSIGTNAFDHTADNFKIYCYKDTAGEQYAIDNGFDYELIAETDPAATHPKVVKIEKNGEFHQFRLKWNEIEGAAQYGIAVKISGKWKVQAYTDKNYFTSPRLRPGSVVEMVICAKVNGKWDTSNINGRAFKVAVK